MCVIIEQKEGYTLPWEMFETASFNNPHGFGLIIKDPKQKRLQVIQRLNEDPKVIYELLKDNDDCIRYLHLRWKTEGDISEENLHPFCVFHSDARQIYFMHNGTLPYKFKPSNTEKISDSKKFNDEWLVPFLTRLHGHNGKGDYHDPWFIKQLYEVWIGDHNRGLIVANDLEPLFVNDKKWCVIKDNKGQEFYASNDTYFKDVVRGPEFEKRKAAKEAAEKAQKTFQAPKASSEGIPKIVIPLKDIDLKPIVPLSSDLSDIFEDADLYSTEGFLSLAAVTSSEFDELALKSPDVAASLLIMITSEYKDLYYELKDLQKAVKLAKEKGDLKELPKL